MTKGNITISELTSEEYRAGMAAIKLVRGNGLRNSYVEGFRDGFEEAMRISRGEKPLGEQGGWHHSHAKALSEGS